MTFVDGLTLKLGLISSSELERNVDMFTLEWANYLKQLW